MNKCNAVHGDELTEPPRQWNSQPPSVHLKACSPHPNTSPGVLSIVGRLNYHAINNGDVEVYNSDFPLGYASDSVPDQYNTPIKLIYDNKMYHLLELFH